MLSTYFTVFVYHYQKMQLFFNEKSIRCFSVVKYSIIVNEMYFQYLLVFGLIMFSNI